MPIIKKRIHAKGLKVLKKTNIETKYLFVNLEFCNGQLFQLNYHFIYKT